MTNDTRSAQVTEPTPEAASQAVVKVLYEVSAGRAGVPVLPDVVAARLMVRPERARYWLSHAQAEGFVQLVRHEHAAHFQLTDAGAAWARGGYREGERE